MTILQCIIVVLVSAMLHLDVAFPLLSFGRKQVCRGADVVYLLSALDLESPPSDRSELQDFRTGIVRTCTQWCRAELLLLNNAHSQLVVSDDGFSNLVRSHSKTTMRQVNLIICKHGEILKDQRGT